ncbi:hypothetical protein QSJ19_02930 [Gordonia sp. ABSL11-1]|uniref:hypothetical protein n=1 Tax=Gordonia sp. ABSL11-1 TaxID=3053924 RepID=UPI002572283E|nr:hypothetical protein [Gordonia sp. ABSL11-1]MDL9944555.1 hypothetical protein [Gordonia sp. ABSL11-1]
MSLGYGVNRSKTLDPHPTRAGIDFPYDGHSISDKGLDNLPCIVLTYRFRMAKRCKTSTLRKVLLPALIMHDCGSRAFMLEVGWWIIRISIAPDYSTPNKLWKQVWIGPEYDGPTPVVDTSTVRRDVVGEIWNSSADY